MTPKVLYSLLKKSPANREMGIALRKCKVLLKDALILIYLHLSRHQDIF